MERRELFDKPAVLLVNLGTPQAPTTPALRKYLRQFLKDRRVIEMTPAVWHPILEGIVLRVRPRKSAAKYRTVWQESGSPLYVYTLEQAKELGRRLAGRASIFFAMRYGEPGVSRVLDSIYALGYRRVLVVPLYPQYSATTVGTVADEVFRWGLGSRDQLDLRIMRSFPKDEGYIHALASAVQSHWTTAGKPDFAAGAKLVLSYHGIPLEMHKKGDPYHWECKDTTSALAEALGMDQRHVVHAYQSKFGPAKWLTPATIDTIGHLGSIGTPRVDVVCPGFVSDCLETIEEIDDENREEFTSQGGGTFHYIPWGNTEVAWMDALTNLVTANLCGWVDQGSAEGTK